jgi:hypothetical protein
MVFANMPKNVEARHRLHFDVSDDYLWADCVELLDSFGRGIEGENLMPFLPAERYNDLYHGGLVVYNDDLCHSRRAENISELRKGKQKRETLTKGVGADSGYRNSTQPSPAARKRSGDSRSLKSESPPGGD